MADNNQPHALADEVPDEEQLTQIYLGAAHWNAWRKDHRSVPVNLRGANLDGADLNEADLSGADLRRAKLYGAELRYANLSRADLSGADLRAADLTGAELSYVNLTDADITHVMFTRHGMRGMCVSVRGIDSAYGNALFKRAVADEDYIESLEMQWAGTLREILFDAWGVIDYGRCLSCVVVIAVALMALYGAIYALWPELVGLNCTLGAAGCPRHGWFTPFYFSIVTYTTLGFGDIAAKSTAGEIIVSLEVLTGYTTLGLLLSVLADKVARRS